MYKNNNNEQRNNGNNSQAENAELFAYHQAIKSSSIYLFFSFVDGVWQRICLAYTYII